MPDRLLHVFAFAACVFSAVIPAHADEMRLTQGIYALSYSGNGERLAAGGLKGEIKVWDVGSKAEITGLKIEDTVAYLHLSETGDLLLANQNSREPLANLVDVEEGATIRHFVLGEQSKTHVSMGSSIEFSPDGEQVMFGNTTARGSGIFETSSGRLLLRYDSGIPRHADCTADSSWSVMACTQNGPTGMSSEGFAELAIVDLETGEPEAEFSLEPLVLASDIRMLDPGHLAIGSICTSPEGCGIALVDLESRSITKQFNPFYQPGTELHRFSQLSVYAFAVSDDGRYIAAGSNEGHYAVWQISPLQPVVIEKVSDEMIRALAFSPDGQTLAIGGDDTLVHVKHIESD